MKRFIGTIKRTSQSPGQSFARSGSAYPAESPEATVAREVAAFCETGGADKPGDEFLHLPAIVEAAESSPPAAQAAAQQIHKFLSKPNTSRPGRQYNSIMLVRILTDNPGPGFTQNIDSRFVSSVKALLRDGRDMNVQQILRETLESLEQNKSSDTNLAELLEMWKKEKEKFARNYNLSPLPNAPQPVHDYFSRQHKRRGLPPPRELASRVSEANSSSNLLLQMVQSTPMSEFQQNELLKEFAGRCQAASKSIQSYIDTTDPAPDEDTMLTLIETNDKLSVSLSKYQRAALTARKTFPSPQPQQSQPQPQETNPPPTNDDESKTTSKNRLLPRLSLRRKPSKAVREPSAQPPPPAVPTRDSKPTTAPQPARAPSGDVSPIGPVAATMFPPSSTNGTTTATNNRSTAAPTGGYKYNSDDFQIENPFADTYSTSNNKDDDTNPGKSTKEPSKPTTSTAPQIPKSDFADFQTYQPSGSNQSPSTTTNTAPTTTTGGGKS